MCLLGKIPVLLKVFLQLFSFYGCAESAGANFSSFLGTFETNTYGVRALHRVPKVFRWNQSLRRLAILFIVLLAAVLVQRCLLFGKSIW